MDILSNEENARLENAPVLIAILIGAVDGLLDREEKTWAEKITVARTYSKPEALRPFYERVSNGFWGKIEAAQKALPTDAETRNSLISNELEKLNPILAKLPESLAAGLFRSFRSLAEEVAKASGGFLRIGAVSLAEHRWVGLPMLRPIVSADLNAEISAEWRADDAEKEREAGW